MANTVGVTDKVEYWSPYGNHVVCWLEGVSVRMKGLPFENASDPDWFVSVDGKPPTQVQTVYYRDNAGNPWDAKVHAGIQKYPTPDNSGFIYNILFHYSFIGAWNHDDEIWRFQHWDGSIWEATIFMIGSYTTGDIQPKFNLKKVG